jgi:hypothetical protein
VNGIAVMYSDDVGPTVVARMNLHMKDEIMF